jgi:hypothetical protein
VCEKKRGKKRLKIIGIKVSITDGKQLRASSKKAQNSD